MLSTRSLLLCFLICTPIALVAQETGALRIFVSDPSGAAIAAANILIQDEQKSPQRVDANDVDSSLYVAQRLAPGVYRLEVDKAGFDSYVIENLLIHARESQVLHITLRVSAAAKQTVTVTSVTEGI